MGTGPEPKRWVELENWPLAFDERVLERPRDRSPLSRRGRGKSSPNKILLALAKGRSPKLTLALFMAAKTFFSILKSDN